MAFAEAACKRWLRRWATRVPMSERLSRRARPHLHIRLSLVVGLCLVLCSSQPGLAQAAEPFDAMASRTEHLAAKMFSEPHHFAADVEQRGISFHRTFVQDWSNEWNDADDPATGFGRYSLDLAMAVDGEKLAGWKGSNAAVRLKQHIVEFGSGDGYVEQLYSNIDASSRTYLYELWLEQQLGGSRLRLKGGKFDANSEFAVVVGAGDFINSSMGYSPTIMAFPTYPSPKLGLGAFLKVSNSSAVSAGVFQTDGWGTLTVIEPGRRWTAAGDNEGRVSIGYWRLDGDIPHWDGSRSGSTRGVYGVLEQSLWRAASSEPEKGRRLSSFLQLGHSNAAVSTFSGHAGAGFVLQSPLARRAGDSLGIAATWVNTSSQMTAAANPGSELVLESYYKILISRWVALLEDFQYFRQAAGEGDGPVTTSRLIVTF